MIILSLNSGLGNQLFQYAMGRRLAHKRNTELKMELNWYERYPSFPYTLNEFNIKESFATAEDISRLKEITPNNSLGVEGDINIFSPEVLDYPDDVYLRGNWECERYFADIADIIRQEFTLKNPLSAAAQHWKEKILSCECSVSMHVRHGDSFYGPQFNKQLYFAIIPIDYYYECIQQLKQQHEKFTLFVFSNDLAWCKKNFHTDVPIEFVEGEGLKDFEELHLMSVCKHNIIANSTFSWWGAWLNGNPDKKVFVPIPSTIVGTKNTYRQFSAERNENSPLETDRWIRIPFDVNAQPLETLTPYFSLLIVLNNNTKTLVKSLSSMLAQDYESFELIIVDNASTDGSGEICKEIAKTFDNITVIELRDKVQNGAAWNIALEAAKGHYVLFLKGDDRMPSNALTAIAFDNIRITADVINSFSYIKEDERGEVDFFGQKFTAFSMSAFKSARGVFQKKLDKSTLLKILAQDEKLFPIGTRVFSREFLEENKIRFNEKIGDDAENLFALEAMFQTDKIIFILPIFYAAP